MAKPVSYAHYAWAFGHVLVLLGSLFSFLGVLTFSFRPRWYKTAYGGAILSWGIVCYKSLGVPSPSRAWIHKALMDENVQYLLLAFTWYMQAPIYVTLIPFATFSLFHTLTFVRTTLLPKPAPTQGGGSSAGSQAQAQQQQAGLSRTLQVWIKNNYEKAMLFVAYIEAFLVCPRLLLGALLFFTPLRCSLFAPLFYAHFLRLRYYLSPQTKAAFRAANVQLDKLLASGSVPGPVKQGVTHARTMIAGYANSILPGDGAAPGVAQPGGGNTRQSEGRGR